MERIDNTLIPAFTYKPIGFIYQYIQSVPPIIIDESLELYDLLRKVIVYANELGERNNELMGLTEKLVDFLNSELEKITNFINDYFENLNREWQEYQATLNKEFADFKNEINEKLRIYQEELKQKLNNEIIRIDNENTNYKNEFVRTMNEKFQTMENNYNTFVNDVNTKVRELETDINNYISDYNSQFTTFQTNINNKVTQYNNDLTNQLNNSNTDLTNKLNTAERNVQNELNNTKDELDRMLNSTDMQEKVNQSLENVDLEELLKNLYGSIIRITYWNTENPPRMYDETPVYHYNPDTNVLTDCTTQNQVDLIENSVYLYEDRVYLVDNTSSVIGTNYNSVGDVKDYDLEYMLLVQDTSTSTRHLVKRNGEVGADYLIRDGIDMIISHLQLAIMYDWQIQNKLRDFQNNKIAIPVPDKYSSSEWNKNFRYVGNKMDFNGKYLGKEMFICIFTKTDYPENPESMDEETPHFAVALYEYSNNTISLVTDLGELNVFEKYTTYDEKRQIMNTNNVHIESNSSSYTFVFLSSKQCWEYTVYSETDLTQNFIGNVESILPNYGGYSLDYLLKDFTFYGQGVIIRDSIFSSPDFYYSNPNNVASYNINIDKDYLMFKTQNKPYKVYCYNLNNKTFGEINYNTELTDYMTPLSLNQYFVYNKIYTITKRPSLVEIPYQRSVS